MCSCSSWICSLGDDSPAEVTAGLSTMARATARRVNRVDSHLHLWTPDEVPLIGGWKTSAAVKFGYIMLYNLIKIDVIMFLWVCGCLICFNGWLMVEDLFTMCCSILSMNWIFFWLYNVGRQSGNLEPLQKPCWLLTCTQGQSFWILTKILSYLLQWQQ